MVLSAFQHGIHFTPRTADRYARLAASSSFVAALAHDLPRTPAPGVRGVALRAVDPLRAEWNVTVVGAHFAAAFVARDLGDDGSDGARRFDYCITYERDLVIRAAQALLVAVDPVRGTA